MRLSFCARGVVVLVKVAALPAAAMAGPGATFYPIGRLSGAPQPFSAANGVSGDGTQVIGYSNSAPGYQAVKWTIGGGLVGLGDLGGGSFDSEARAISGNGQVAVGHGTNAQGHVAARFSGGTIQPLGDLAGGVFNSDANGVSADGQTIVGQSSSTTGYQAFRWRGGTMSGIGYLGDSGGTFYSTAAGCSGDGELVTGLSSSAEGYQAFGWSSAGGMAALGDLPGGSFTSYGAAVSRDGSTIVGYATDENGMQPAVWRNGPALGGPGGGWTGPQLLGASVLSGENGTSYASGVNPDGSVIVGSAIGYGAFVWTAAGGMRSLQQMLASDYGITLPHWTLVDAKSVSDDGSVIAGIGWNVLAAGGPGYEGFVVVLPGPGVAVGMAIGLIGFAGRRRRG